MLKQFKPVLVGVIGFIIVFGAFVLFTGCGNDWIVPQGPYEIPTGCWIVQDPVTVLLPTGGKPLVFEVPSILCPAPTETTPTDPVTTPSDPVVTNDPDAGNPPDTDGGVVDNDPDAGTPPPPPVYVRFNPNNGKCYKVSRGQIDPHGQHHGWVITTTEEVDCPSIQGLN